MVSQSPARPRASRRSEYNNILISLLPTLLFLFRDVLCHVSIDLFQHPEPQRQIAFFYRLFVREGHLSCYLSRGDACTVQLHATAFPLRPHHQASKGLTLSCASTNLLHSLFPAWRFDPRHRKHWVWV